MHYAFLNVSGSRDVCAWDSNAVCNMCKMLHYLFVSHWPNAKPVGVYIPKWGTFCLKFLSWYNIKFSFLFSILCISKWKWFDKKFSCNLPPIIFHRCAHPATSGNVPHDGSCQICDSSSVVNIFLSFILLCKHLNVWTRQQRLARFEIRTRHGVAEDENDA